MNFPPKSIVNSIFLVAVALCIHSSATAADLRYRVSGIIETGSKSLAMIESSDGQQAVYRSGDQIGSGVIGSIAGDGVIVIIKEDAFLLPLQGEPTLLRELELSKAGYHMKIGDGIGQYKIDFDAAKEALMAASRPPDDKEKNNPEYMYQRISAALALPAGARIESVSEQDVGSAGHAMLALLAQMNQDHLRLKVSGVPGVERVYISGQKDLWAVADPVGKR